MQLTGSPHEGTYDRAPVPFKYILEVWLEVEAGDGVEEAVEAVAEGGLMLKVMAAMTLERSSKSGQRWVRIYDILYQHLSSFDACKT